MIKIKVLSSCTLLVSSLVFSQIALSGQVGYDAGAAANRDQIDLINRSRNLNKAVSNFADDFSVGSINRSNYNRSEAIREIDTDKGMLHVFTGAYNTTAGVTFTRTNNWISGSETHTSIEADVIVTEVQFGSANHPAFAHLGGTFYSNSATVNGRLGHVFAQIKIGKRGDGFQVWGSIGKSLDSSFSKDEAMPDIIIVEGDSIKLGDTVSLSLEYNGGNSFTFSAKVNNKSFTKTISNAPARLANAKGMKRIGTGIDWDYVGGVVDESPASVDALFDNVKTNGNIFGVDDFSDSVIDGKIWKNDNRSPARAETRIVETLNGNSVVRLETQGNGAQRDVNFEIRNETDFLEADLMLSSQGKLPSGTRGLVRIQGQWYNDSFASNYEGNTGDVYAHLIIDKTPTGDLVAKAYAGRMDNKSGSVITELHNEQFSKSIAFDTFYKASVEFTGSTIRFTFDGQVIIMPIDTAVNKASFRTKRIRARVDKGAGKVVAFVDNIRTSTSAKLPEESTPNPDNSNNESPDGSDTSDTSGGGVPWAILLMLTGLVYIKRR